MKIHVSRIDPNPFRDFDIDPINPERVNKLTKSIHDHDFWNGLIVRCGPIVDNEESFHLIFGHHRLEAAKAAGIEYIQAPVVRWNDDRVIKAMAAENATQRETNFSACANDVAAAMEHLGYQLLVNEKCPKHLGKIFPSSKSFDVAKGMFLKGNGLGKDIVNRYFEETLSMGDIREAIVELKASGKYGEITRKAIDRAANEGHIHPEPENCDDIPTFDMAVGQVFPQTSHLRAFRTAVTTDLAKKYVPVEKQVQLAKDIRKFVEEQDHNSSVTEAGIKKATSQSLQTILGIETKEARTVRDKDDREQAKYEWGRLRNSIAKAASNCRRLLELIEKGANPNDFDPEFAAAYFYNEVQDFIKLMDSLEHQLPINISLSSVTHINPNTKVLENENH